MKQCVKPGRVGELIPTRQSLLSRLKDWQDQKSWQVFFDTYWQLIYGTALRAGLSDAEAQDVVQETIIAISKQMPTFHYDAKKGSFKSWLLNQTQWRIADQFRKRPPETRAPAKEKDAARPEFETLEDLPDPAQEQAEEAWERAWEENLMFAAVQRVRRKVRTKQFQVFDMHVLQGWPASKVSDLLGVNTAMVYLIKHRVSRLVKKEVAYLQTKPI